MLESLPSDAIVHILQRFELQALPPVLRSIALCCHAWADALTGDVYDACALRFSGGAADAARRRTSTRLLVVPRVGCGQKFMALRARSEALHHALACAGQDSRDLSVRSIRKWFAESNSALKYT